MSFAEAIFDRLGYKLFPIEFSRKKGVQIGNHCELRGRFPFGSEPYLVSIGNHVRVNAGVEFVTHDGSAWVLRGLAGTSESFPDNLSRADIFGKITIGNNVQINSNVIILPGVTIGDNCIIGAGAIVTKDIPSGNVAAGIPARVVESVQEYYYKHQKKGDLFLTKGMNREELKEQLKQSFDLEKNQTS